ncbi:MAG: glycosyltransferase family 9 protein [Gammaproteobacteria bacterium]|nr:glycosyltransferase family 9 protein [Gammaproteobacteria bacterium]
MRKTKLLLRLPNWVGDVIMSLPCIDALHKNFDLELIGKAWTNDFLAGLKLPCHTLAEGFYPRVKQLRALNTDKILLLTNSFGSALQSCLAGLENIGYQADGRSFLLTKSMPKTANRHEVEYFWQLGQFTSQHYHAGSWPAAIPKKINLPLTATQRATAKQALNQAKITNDFYLLAPFAAGTNKAGDSKVWPHWLELIKKLNAQNITCVVCPGPNELAESEKFINSGAIILRNIKLDTYAAIIAEAKYAIGNDSGPTHIANAVNTPALTIFGTTNPKRAHPWSGEYIGSQNGWPETAEVFLRVT